MGRHEFANPVRYEFIYDDGHGNLPPFGSSTGGNQGDPRMTVVASHAILTW